MSEQKFYTVNDVKHITGCTSSTLYRWSQELRDTALVDKRGGIVYLNDDFVRFIRRRVHRGPANLPNSKTIGRIFSLWNAHHNITIIASDLMIPLPLAEKFLEELGIEHEQSEE